MDCNRFSFRLFIPKLWAIPKPINKRPQWLSSQQNTSMPSTWASWHQLPPFLSWPGSSYLPDLVRIIIALAQHLKADSTAPMATASEGSLLSFVERLSSSNSCRWNMAASASLAIWVCVREEEDTVPPSGGRWSGKGRGYNESVTPPIALTSFEQARMRDGQNVYTFFFFSLLIRNLMAFGKPVNLIWFQSVVHITLL